MDRFQKKFPNIDFEISTSNDPDSELALKKYDIIITGMSSHDRNYTFIPLFEDQVVCVMGESHPLTAQSYIRLEDFREMSMISHAEKENNNFYQQALKTKDIEPRRYMTVGQPQAIIEMVASGFGVTVLPMWAVKSSIKTHRITTRPITRTGLPLTWIAAFLNNANMPIYQKEFINIIKKINPAN